MMIDDHGKANEELQALARSKGITMPSTLDSAHQRQLDELSDLSGATFDSKYHEMQVAAHDGAIELFEKTARDSTDSDVRAFATKTLPTLRKHRAALDDIQIPR
jgi:putative membrane protein